MCIANQPSNIMKPFLLKIQFILALCGSFLSLQGTNYYIQYNNSCIATLEFEVTDANGKVKRTYSYQINNSAADRIQFELATAGIIKQDYWPGQMLGCSDLYSIPSLVESINNGVDFVYFVRQGEKKVELVPVASATYIKIQNGSITYTSRDLSFHLSNANGFRGENLSTRTGQFISFEGTLTGFCPTTYLFRQKYHSSYNTGLPAAYSISSDFLFLETLGFIEKKTTSSISGITVEMVKLARINGIFTYDWLASLCTGSKYQILDIAAEKRDLTEYAAGRERYNYNAGTTTPRGVTNYDFTGTFNSPQVKDPCNEISGNGIHIVRKNETLFGIAERYDLSVEELKNINNLPSNILSPCTRLIVNKSGQVGPPRQSAPTDYEISRRPSNTPDFSTERQYIKSGTENTISTIQHRVNTYDNYYSLATQYRYPSVERFLLENNFRQDTRLTPGQIINIKVRISAFDNSISPYK